MSYLKYQFAKLVELSGACGCFAGFLSSLS